MDETPGPDESSLSPADDARIRHLLAEARHTEPVPEAVGARLDRVLSGLYAERAESDEQSQRAAVVNLAARRRRATSLLIAAAAVVVAGVGIGQILPGSQGGNEAATDSANAPAETAGDSAGGANLEKNPAERAPSSSDSATPATPSQLQSGGSDYPARAVRVRSAHFGHDVRKARDSASTPDSSGMAVFAAPVCPVGDVGEGTAVAARYDGVPAFLVLRPPAGDVQVVDLYICGTTDPARSITLTAPTP